MRLSVEPGDPGFNPLAAGAGVRVYLDGRRVVDCVTADEEAGKVWILARTDDGTVCEDPTRPGHAAMLERSGKVRIVIPAEAAESL